MAGGIALRQNLCPGTLGRETGQPGLKAATWAIAVRRISTPAVDSRSLTVAHRSNHRFDIDQTHAIYRSLPFNGRGG